MQPAQHVVPSKAPIATMQVRRAAPVVAVSALTLLTVLVFGLVIRSDPAWSQAELQLVAAINGAHNPLLDGVGLFIEFALGTSVAPIVLVIVATVIGVTSRSLPKAVWFTFLASVAWLGCSVIKVLVHRPRPDVSALTHVLVDAPDMYSYPSGHTTFAVALCVAAITVVKPKGAVRVAFFAVTTVFVGAVAYSRVYLGVHHVSDVLAAVAYTIPAVALLDMTRHPAERLVRSLSRRPSRDLGRSPGGPAAVRGRPSASPPQSESNEPAPDRSPRPNR